MVALERSLQAWCNPLPERRGSAQVLWVGYFMAEAIRMSRCWVKRLVLVGALLHAGLVCAAVRYEAGAFIDEVERLRDLAFDKDTGLYIPPTNEELADFYTMAESLLSGDLAATDALAGPLGYEVVAFTNASPTLVFHGLRERLDLVATNGWGSFFLNTSPEVPNLIEIPHPRFDTYSWDVGGRAFVNSRAKGLLMAGAHRNANGSGTADVAHLTNTMFHVVHKAWSTTGIEAWQIHGFAITNHPGFPIGTDAILSNGDGGVSHHILELDAAFQTNGFLAYAFNELAANSAENLQVNEGIDGTTFSGLGAKSNDQGKYARSLGETFVHVEMEKSIRFDGPNRITAAALVADAIRASSVLTPVLSAFNPTSATSATVSVESMVLDREYGLLESTNLVAETWSTAQLFSASSVGTNLVVPVEANSAARFFRIELH
jgi:hypothetical protein